MRNRGFTIIEATVALFVLTTGVLGAYSLIQRTIAFTSVSASRLTASYLAQEGTEIVRNFRDSNYLQGLAWDNGLSACAAGCEVDYNDSVLSVWIDPGRFLKVDNNFVYNYETGTDTYYKRKIIISPSDGILDVSVQVSWQERGRSHQVTAQTRLRDWR
jgi:hypothetical protein